MVGAEPDFKTSANVMEYRCHETLVRGGGDVYGESASWRVDETANGRMRERDAL